MPPPVKDKGSKDKGSAPKKAKGKIAYTLFSISGSKLERKNKSCPKCGSGTFMAEHANRRTCGKCNYTEFKKG